MIIRDVASRKETDRFIKFPWKIYKDCRSWVPPLILERRELLNPQKNPFFAHAEVKLCMAFDDAGTALGRIAGIVNHSHNRIHKDKTGFFGLFECVDDQAVAHALLDAAAGFLRSRGMEIMRGPENMCVNDDIGLLIDGFDAPPAIMMPYNPPYYERLVESYGFAKSMDLYAYWGEAVQGQIPERVARGADICRKRYRFSVRSLRMREFNAELERIQVVYNAAWEDNWGAVAMTDAEFKHLAGSLKQVVDPDLCLIGELDGEVAGFSIALPDFNQVLTHLDGRLFPFGIFKLLYQKRRINAVRVITLGVVKKFRNKGLDNWFVYETYRRALAKGMGRGELSWVLENNGPMNRALQNLGFSIHKRYRLYDISLNRH